MSSQALALGFANPVFDAQAVFKAVMWALSRPGRVEGLDVSLAPPAPLSPEAAAVVLALADYETPLWLDPALAESPDVGAFLRFHTGAPIVSDPGAARFAVISKPLKMLDFHAFPQGSPDYPDISATLIVQVERFSAAGLVLEGPGIKGRQSFGAHPLPDDMAARLRANRGLFPRGVDLVFAGAGGVVALPRSVSVVEG